MTKKGLGVILETKEIEIKESVYERNEEIAKELNNELTSEGIFCVNVMGAPGVGKTSALYTMIGMLDGDASVIEGDIESEIDTLKLRKLGINAYQINTNGACHLDSPVVKDAIKTFAPPSGYLFIENIGNLVCPAEFLIGEHIKMLISTVTEGSDKPYKYPLAFEKADIILINKADIEKYVEFDRDYFTKGVKALNKNVPVFFVSSKTGEGFEEVALWIKTKRKELIGK